MRYRAILAYDGTAYRGFQWQPQVPTIQGEVERALAQATQQSVRVVAAGRTDAGVHAIGQVIAFDVPWCRDPESLHRALNALLPADIAVQRLQTAWHHFHPRYDARSRTYRYSILRRPWLDPLRRRFAYHVPHPLDVSAMDSAARSLVGVHDFCAFGRPTREGGPTVRRVLTARCWAEGSLVHFEIEANAFLRRMVRRLMGALLWVGGKRYSASDLEAVLHTGMEGQASPAVSPHGLCLRRVAYEWQWEQDGEGQGVNLK